MLSSIIDYLKDVKEEFSPIYSRAEDEDPTIEEEEEEEEEEEDDDEEEEEDEEGDQFDKLRKQCENTEKGQELKHHYLECVERVQKAKEDPNYENLEYKEDCVEEFFHLQHYVDECAAPRLFSQLK